ncbi:hypothetical protein SK128_010978 [Halocaridina rubra]|uniref:Major facilitator superfamily (MFS) profile domain-containing protein n=1 Tax=Halocaridina rubra TaxID=373956 RepID=A0AAN8WUS5_HALRR
MEEPDIKGKSCKHQITSPVHNRDKKENDEEPASKKRLRYLKQVGLFFAAAMGHWNLGLSLSWPNTLASDLQMDNLTLFGTELHLADWEMDMTSSMLFIGTLPGFVFGGWLVAWLGRRKSMMVLAIPASLGWMLIALAINSPMILLGRFIVGIAYALLGVAVRTYLVEISDTEIRGAAGLTTEVMKGIGAIGVTGLGMILPWYHLAFVSTCHIMIYGLLIVPFLPESPTYLLVKGKEDKAHQVLQYLRGKYANLDEEMKQLKAKNECHTGKKGWRIIFKADIIKKCSIVFGLFFISNFCGSEVIRANALRMLQTSGLSLDKDLSTIFIFVLLLSGNISQALIIDRIGRRKCLALSLLLLMIAYAILGSYVFLQSQEIEVIHLLPEGNGTVPEEGISLTISKTWNWIPTVCLMSAAFSISLGIGPIPWMLSVEYFPTHIRSQVMSVCTFIGNLMSFVALQIYSPLQVLLTPAGLYWSYSCFALIGILYTILFVTETKGKRVG